MQLSRRSIFNKVTAATSKVTDKEIQDYYTRTSRRTRRRRRTVRHILVRCEAEAADTQAGDKVTRASKKVLADQLEQQLRTGASFAALAAKYSQDPGSQEEGGKLSDVAKGQTVPPFDKIAFSIKTGDDLAAGEDAVRLAHHPGARRRSRPAKKTPLDAGQGADQAAAAAAEEDRRSAEMGEGLPEEPAKASAVKYQAGFQPPATPPADHRDRPAAEWLRTPWRLAEALSTCSS